MNFQEHLLHWRIEEHVSTEDVLAAFVPLMREVIETHQAGLVAPLVGLQDLHIDQARIWFEKAKRQPVRNNSAAIKPVEQTGRLPIEVLAEARRITDVDDGEEKLARIDIAERGQPIVRPVYLPGYVAWEHELEHHDPLTDIFSLGMLLASLACQLNLNEPADLESFVVQRRNLFSLNSQLHPVIAQAILRMTELRRHDRAQDLTALLRSLENYRDQTVSLEIDLARMAGFRTRDVRTKQQVVLTKLRDRLFDISRRNNLLHFRPTMQSINLTQASMPLMLNIRSIREDQVLVWNSDLQKQIVDDKPISLNKHLNFNEALYLPSLLERIIADARRDQTEFGFAQLRLAICFLSWANVKEKPIEQFVSPLVLLPVRLVKNKGIRDTYSLDPLSPVAEVNPVLRHQFRQLYNIELPESIDLETTRLETLYEFLSAKIQASEPAVSLNLIDRPRIDLIHEKAKRRLDQFRRSARVSGRGVRHFGSLDYSYDPLNYHPLGVKLFSAKVRAPDSHLRQLIETNPRPRSFAAPEPEAATVEIEKSFYQLRDNVEANPYLWNFDLCNLTLANFHYRRMSLVRDYEHILNAEIAHPVFEAAFSLAPRPVRRELTTTVPLAERFDVVLCDPTQTTAIAEARLGTNYIIQGPPGTGKSQTITNLIADFVARGKRVLFVCEKRAALDVVFARLRQCGLGMLCSVIHDSQSDKKEFILDLKQFYEQVLADNSARSKSPTKRTTALRSLEQNLGALEAFESAMEADLPQCSGLAVRTFLNRCVELIESLPPLEPEDMERLPSYDQWWNNADQLATLDATIRYLEPSGVLSKHPLRRLSPALSSCERPIERVQNACRQALAAIDILTTAVQHSGIPADGWRSLQTTHQLLDYAKEAATIASNGNFSLADPTSDRSMEFSNHFKQLEVLDYAAQQARQSTTAWRTKFSSADVQTAIDQAKTWNGKWFAWLSPAWWRLRALLNRNYDFSAHAIRPSWLQVLTALQEEHVAQRAIDEHARQMQTTFGISGDPRHFHQSVEAFRKKSLRLPEWLRRIHAALIKSPKAVTFIERILAADESTIALTSELHEVLIDFEELPIDALRRELTAIQGAARQVPEVLSVLKELATLPPAIGATLRQSDFTISQAESAIAYRTWDRLVRGNRPLNQFDQRAQEQSTARLELCYERWQKSNAAEILRRTKDRFVEHVRISNSSATQLSAGEREFKRRYSQGRRTLEHEFGKSMRYKAIRELVEGDAAQVIKDLKPVWLMSPLSVSDTLPLATDLFDVVIFDEASQVPLEESVPTLFRGQQTIVVGDEMQLPPTDFFSAKQSDEDDELVVEEGGQQVNYDLDSDSLLNHAARNLPSTMLGWHYRSRSETLISFSNWAFYDGRLLTVPDHQLLASSTSGTNRSQPTAESFDAVDHLLGRPVSYHYLKDGVYNERQNRCEAEYIADLVRGLLQKRANLSIGVIAFSEAQQTEIEAAIARLARDDDDFRPLYEEELEREIDGQFVGLLVKNLENIQGDERDIVILSVCYGAGPNGRMLMNFGPINKSGGEKRLNVAFSRAKRHMAVVSSIQYSAITNDYNDGAACLKNYLRYAEALSSGDMIAAHRVLKSIARWGESVADQNPESADPICRQLADALRKRDYLVDLNVGQSHFRVDLVVRSKAANQQPLGILVDTVSKYEHSDALERDLLRPRLLRSFGWRLTGVLAKDWYLSRDQELQRIISLLQRSEAEWNAKDSIATDDEIDEPSSIDSDPVDNIPMDAIEKSTADFIAVEALEIEPDTPIEADNSTNHLASSQVEPVAAIAQVSSAKPTEVADGACRYFEFKDDKSNKFWEISIKGCQHTVRFGRIGSQGQSQTKVFPNDLSARSDAAKLINEKTKKGYREHQ
jgi:predicted DNA-binding WGR domain protein